MTASPPRSRRRTAFFGAALLLGLALVVPPVPARVTTPALTTPFRWDADQLFASLEAEFARSAGVPPSDAESEVAALEAEGAELLRTVEASEATPHESVARLATLQFELAVQGAAHESLLPRVQGFMTRVRVRVMRAASGWTPDRGTHEALYRVLFGGRVALEEALIQAGTGSLPALQTIEDLPSQTPSIVVQGVRVHSGDVLLSRGGAPTSALIARGNDFPNAFSHAALAHVDGSSGEGTVIESLIETGSSLTTVDEYLASQKHRVVVLRLRPDHPRMVADPLLPHRAAESMLQRLRADHIPYDFAMEWDDPSEAFCSEIVYHAYRGVGVDLWALRSSMTAPGLVDWLAVMGVRQFTSLVPSDLEYDPQMRAVLEWRDAPAMMDYRLDNAVIDALLEEADRGADLGYSWYALPFARLLKAYSVGVGVLGRVPPIPRGMDAPTALRVRALVSTVHPTVKGALEERAAAFLTENGYEAPYWQLVELARGALAGERAALHPALTHDPRAWR